MNIEKTLQERFAAPLQENYKRRIIFWQDPEGEFSTLVDELRLDGVRADLLSIRMQELKMLDTAPMR